MSEADRHISLCASRLRESRHLSDAQRPMSQRRPHSPVDNLRNGSRPPVLAAHATDNAAHHTDIRPQLTCPFLPPVTLRNHWRYASYQSTGSYSRAQDRASFSFRRPRLSERRKLKGDWETLYNFASPRYLSGPIFHRRIRL